MEKYIGKYMNEIEVKKFQNFDTFFESDEFNSINNEEIKRKLFYYYALKYSSERNKNILQLYIDLKKILEKMENIDYLKNYDKECYIAIINNYIEKIQLFIAENKFFKMDENYNHLRDIIKLFKDQYKNKKKCVKEVSDNLEELYDILKIKKKYKIPQNMQKRMERHLNDFYKLLDDIKKADDNQINQIEDINKENIKRQINDNYNNNSNYNSNNNSNNSNNSKKSNNIKNNNNFFNNNMNNFNNMMMYEQNIPYNQFGVMQRYYDGYNYKNNNQQINQYNESLQNNNKKINNNNNEFNNQIGQSSFNDKSSLKKSLICFDNQNDYFILDDDIDKSYKHEGCSFVDNILGNNNNSKNSKNNNSNNKEYKFINNNDFSNFEIPNNNNNIQQKHLIKSKEFTNENLALSKSKINPNNPYKCERKQYENNNDNNELQNKMIDSGKKINNSKKVKKSVIERRSKYDEIKKRMKKMDESDFD